jgi:hypothetical protein
LTNMSVLSAFHCQFSKRRLSSARPVTIAIFILALFVALSGRVPCVHAASIEKSDGEKSINNTDVITMAKVGLGDDIVIAKIQQAPREELDVSVQALIDLKKRGLSKAIIEAMIKRVDKRAKQSTTVPPESGPLVSEGRAMASASKEPACIANFETEGGFLTGETKRSFRDYTETEKWESLFDSMVRSVTTGGWQISSSNKEAGTVTGVANVRNVVEDVRQMLGGGVTKLTLNVLLKRRESAGIRVETVLLIPAGTKLTDKDAKTVFCRILGSTAP